MCVCFICLTLNVKKLVVWQCEKSGNISTHYYLLNILFLSIVSSKKWSEMNKSQTETDTSYSY